MKYIVKLLLVNVCALSCSFLTFSQSVFTVSGGNASGSGGTVTYTTGQIDYKTVNSTSGTISEGIQQPYEITVATAIEEFKDIKLTFSIYPNPTIDLLTLKVGSYSETMKLSYWLYGVNGNLIETKKIYTQDVEISMSQHRSGIYFLKVTSEKKDLITFKVIKN